MSRIIVNSSTPTENGDRIANAMVGLITAIETVKRLQLVAGVNITDPAGTPGYAEVEAEFGLPPGTGEAFYLLLTNGVAALDAGAIGQMLLGIGRR